MKKRITYLDLFSGAGGFAKGLLQAGFIFENHYFSEIDRFAIANYQYNFKNATYVGEIKQVANSGIKRPNLVTFGSPCQDISIASNGKGLFGKKSKLFFKAIEIIKRFKPDCFVLENVRNIFSSNQGKDFKTLLQTIAEIGLYDCQWQLLNSSCVLPQNRERLYLVGSLTDKSRPQVFPLQTAYKKDENLVETGWKKIKNIGSVYLSKQSGKVYNSLGISPTIQAKTSSTGFVKHLSRYRQFTPIEAERIQGFPDNWTRYGQFQKDKEELSDTQRYNLMGNAVSAPLIVQIGSKLIEQKKSLSGTIDIAFNKEKKNDKMGKDKRTTKINELILGYKRSTIPYPSAISSSEDAATILRAIMGEKSIDAREQMIVLYLSRANKVIGYHIHSLGGISATTVDIKIILGMAVKSFASAIILAHNHPSGNIEESNSDKQITQKLKDAAKLHDISLLDHLIITTESHKSFADHGLLGVENKYPIIIPTENILQEKDTSSGEIQIHIENLKKYLSK